MLSVPARFLLSIATMVATLIFALVTLRARPPLIEAPSDNSWMIPPRVYQVTLIPMAPARAAKWSQQPLAPSDRHRWSLNSPRTPGEIDEAPAK